MSAVQTGKSWIKAEDATAHLFVGGNQSAEINALTDGDMNSICNDVYADHEAVTLQGLQYDPDSDAYRANDESTASGWTSDSWQDEKGQWWVNGEAVAEALWEIGREPAFTRFLSLGDQDDLCLTKLMRGEWIYCFAGHDQYGRGYETEDSYAFDTAEEAYNRALLDLEDVYGDTYNRNAMPAYNEWV